ncbi:MAG: Mov34/MPN/PAD-1 family protein [Muribaculaceae bacterium]|nr:Mov34/MPN/PAD-1 family protein [Muribaculaceae bacterium]
MDNKIRVLFGVVAFLILLPLGGNEIYGAPKKSKNKGVSIEELLNSNTFFGQEAVNNYISTCDSLKYKIELSKHKRETIKETGVERFLSESESELKMKRDDVVDIAYGMAAKSTGGEQNLSLVMEILLNRLDARQQAYDNLKEAVDIAVAQEESENQKAGTIINYCIIGVIFIGLVVWMIVMMRRRSAQKSAPRRSAGRGAPSASVSEGGDNNIVVRRRTTSIMRKQSLEDVVGNPAYLEIDCKDYIKESAVRKIYIQNHCINEIYNLYKKDLDESDHPNEDGCMVIGRWVFDQDVKAYDVSMEFVVFPGDDAKFSEYELDFGGQIKLRIMDKLRKLRKDTGLQYDLVCWVHSHPGLGVFFSRSDENVQNQLKHPQHPNFLLAMVVDILTPGWETGIFTFRPDGSLNSRNDLIKLCSFEEFHQWALDHDMPAKSPSANFDLIKDSKVKLPACKSIAIDKEGIAEMDKILTAGDQEFAAWICAQEIDSSSGKDFIIRKFDEETGKICEGSKGALLKISYPSAPTIKRLLSEDLATLSFILAFSDRDQTLTSIPVVNGEIITDEQFYGIIKLEEIISWTKKDS